MDEVHVGFYKGWHMPVWSFPGVRRGLEASDATLHELLATVSLIVLYDYSRPAIGRHRNGLGKSVVHQHLGRCFCCLSKQWN